MTPTLPEQLLDVLRQAPDRQAAGDSLEGWVSNQAMLARAHTWGAALRETLATDEQHVGILLPQSVSGVAATLAVILADRTPVFLNYTASREALQYAIDNCGIRHVLTSPKFAEAVRFPFTDLLLDLSTLKPAELDLPGLMQQPGAALREQFFPNQGCPDDGDRPGTILFSSGSTGTPKGVILTNRNLRTNLEDTCEVLHMEADDLFFGFLPFFHSFGFLATLWLPLVSGRRVYYHPDPTDAANLGVIASREKPTIMFGTATFLKMYMRKCPPDAFQSLRLIITGAEALPPELADAFNERFGVLPVAGYGTTELSPVVSANVPEDHRQGGKACGRRNTVGKALPRVQLKVIDPETRAELAANEEGLILVKGPNVMRGYLNDPERTAKVLKDGWYDTGDIGKVDEDGYLYITGRLSRFSKIAGEMVPHGGVEAAIREASGDHTLVVTGVPDANRGERLIVLHTEPLEAKTAIAALRERGLPNLWIPKPFDFHKIDAIPTLGTGKLDLQAINQLAAELAKK